MIFVTGGAGFIGANFIIDWLAAGGEPVLNLDLLTYAGNPRNLSVLEGDARYQFVQGDVNDGPLVQALLRQHRPRAIIHLAAESHVDRSIEAPAAFIHTNINGTFTLLEAARTYWSTLAAPERDRFRFLHVSTDEVFGALAPGAAPFTETSPYAPNSPYAASKAASDHLVRASFHTYGLPVLTTHCSNNYGPFQFPEKLIPLVICNALAGRALPLYGDGLQVRDWLHVSDHCAALRAVLAGGVPGQTYNMGAGGEMSNLALVLLLCDLLDEAVPLSRSYRELVRHVADRPGHDRRYAIDASKLRGELGWGARYDLATGMRATVAWYLGQRPWASEPRAEGIEHKELGQ